MLYFVLRFGHTRAGRHSRPLPCGRHSHAMLAKDEGHAIGQVGREQGVDVVIRWGVGYGGQAQILGAPPRPKIRGQWGYCHIKLSCLRGVG